MRKLTKSAAPSAKAAADAVAEAAMQAAENGIVSPAIAAASAAADEAAASGVLPHAIPQLAAAVEAAAKPASVPSFLARVQATADAMQYPFANLSNRDDAYIASYAYSAEKRGGSFTLADLLADATPVPGTSKRRNPFAAGIPSAPATDAGAIERAIKCGRITRHEAASGTYYNVTALGAASKSAGIGRDRAKLA